MNRNFRTGSSSGEAPGWGVASTIYIVRCQNGRIRVKMFEGNDLTIQPINESTKMNCLPIDTWRVGDAVD